jgi:hypothetical protein
MIARPWAWYNGNYYACQFCRSGNTDLTIWKRTGLRKIPD